MQMLYKGCFSLAVYYNHYDHYDHRKEGDAVQENRYIYRAFGCEVRSELPFPELPHWEGPTGSDTALEVVVGRLNEVWDAAVQFGRSWASDAASETILFRIPEVAVYAIQGGKRIVVSPCGAADPDQIRLYILGSAMGVLLMQRGILPLHGSAVVIDGKAYAFCGQSGAGKSTLASAFGELGRPLVTDDVIAVSFDGQGRPYVTPSYPQQKLWQASLEQLGMDARRYKPLFQEVNKYAVPVVQQFAGEPVQLAGLFELRLGDKAEHRLERLSPLESLPVLFAHTYRNYLIPMMGLGQWHLDMTAKLAGSLWLARWERGTEGFSARMMAERMTQWIQGEELSLCQRM